MPKKFNVKEVVLTDVKKSSVDMSCNVKGTGKLGRIYPMHTQNLLPNTRINYTPNTLCRFVPLAAPLMSSMTIRHHAFAVPYRQLYKDWEKFITGGEFNTDDSTLPSFTIKDVVYAFNQYIKGGIQSFSTYNDVKSLVNKVKEAYSTLGYLSCFNQAYGELVEPILAATTMTDAIADSVSQFMLQVFNEWFGVGSLMESLGYPVRDWVAYGAEKGINHSTASDSYLNLGNLNGKTFVSAVNSSKLDNDTQYNALPLLAMYRIWYYYFRDENIDKVLMTPEEIKSVITSSVKVTSSANLLKTLFFLRPCCWAKDLFNTSTLQAYQNNAFVPVNAPDNAEFDEFDATSIDVYDAKRDDISTMTVPATWLNQMHNNVNSSDNGPYVPSASVFGITGFSLANLKKVEALSKWLDKNLFTGFQYSEQLLSHFSVRSSDARMQIPEYVGGTKQFVNCQTLTNATTIDSSDGLAATAGDQAGYAQGIVANDGCSYFAEEHCIFIDVMSIVPELSYKYSTDMFLLYQKKFDFPFPEFAQLGSSFIPRGCVANNITSMSAGSNLNLQPFGYADRYWEAKSNVNTIRGKLLEDMPLYYFSQDYYKMDSSGVKGNVPEMSPEFVHCVPSTDVFISDSNEYQFVYDHNSDIKATIPLPVVEYV